MTEQIENEFDLIPLTPKEFSYMVEDKILKGYYYIDACVEVCNMLEYDITEISKLITPSLLHKIEAEAIANRSLKSNSHTLPL
jgi:hypothetical protein